MKAYTKGQNVIWSVKEFDGNFTTDAVITEVGNDYALATMRDGTRLFIDDDTDFMFTIRKEF